MAVPSGSPVRPPKSHAFPPAPPPKNGVDWRAVADILAEELAKWGWGDMHYGPQVQENSVVKALDVYHEAVKSDD